MSFEEVFGRTKSGRHYKAPELFYCYSEVIGGSVTVAASSRFFAVAKALHGYDRWIEGHEKEYGFHPLSYPAVCPGDPGYAESAASYRASFFRELTADLKKVRGGCVLQAVP